GTRISQYAVFGRQVAFVAEFAAGTAGETAIYYSQDAGATYEIVYKQSDTVTALEVSSLIFSTDGMSLLAATVPYPASGRNIVIEIDVASQTAKDLFESDGPGVFLKAFDTAKQQVI